MYTYLLICLWCRKKTETLFLLDDLSNLTAFVVEVASTKNHQYIEIARADEVENLGAFYKSLRNAFCKVVVDKL